MIGESLTGLTLLAMAETGNGNPCKLVSRYHLQGDVDLKSHTDGFIALTGGPDGQIDAVRDGNEKAARDAIRGFYDLFGDRLYVELQRHHEDRELKTSCWTRGYGRTAVRNWMGGVPSSSE